MDAQRLKTMWPPSRGGGWMAPRGERDLVSVIIPAYNRAGLIGQSLESVAAQSARPLEVVVVDDGSTDETAAVAEDWGRRPHDGDLTLRVIRAAHAGAAAARNRGLVECRGESVQFLDSDDLLHPEKIAIQSALLARDEGLDVVYAHTACFTAVADWSARSYVTFPAPGERVLPAFLNGNCWPAPSALFRRRTCLSLGPWDEAALTLEDWDYGIRLLLGGARAAFVDRTLLLYRQGHGARPTVTSRALAPESLRDRYELTLRWFRWVAEAGQFDEGTEAWFLSQFLGVAMLCLSIGETSTARAILRSVRRLGFHRMRTRRGDALMLAAARLPEWCGRPLLRGLYLGLKAKDAAGGGQTPVVSGP